MITFFRSGWGPTAAAATRITGLEMMRPRSYLVMVGLGCLALSVRNALVSLKTSPTTLAAGNDFWPKVSTLDLARTAGRRESLNYVQSIQSLNRTLLFYHIPKTGGTTMEITVAAANNVSWGKCMMEADIKFGCLSTGQRLTFKHKGNSPWHYPPFIFPLQGVNPYAKAELFAIARNPVERLISAYHYWCAMERTCSRYPMSLYIKLKIDSVRRATQFGYGMWTFRVCDGHFTPQMTMVVGPHQVRYIDYVLKYARGNDLARDFSRLVAPYGLGQLQWPLEERDNAGAYDSKSAVAKLERSVVDLIQSTYANDTWLVW